MHIFLGHLTVLFGFSIHTQSKLTSRMFPVSERFQTGHNLFVFSTLAAIKNTIASVIR